MPDLTTANRLLRSLCANAPTEETQAIENYSRIHLPNLLLEGVRVRLLQEISYFYITYGGPPSTVALRERLQQLAESEASLLAAEIEVESPCWGANFFELVSAYQESLGQEKFKAVLTETAQIMKDGIEDRQGLRRGLKHAMEHVIRGTVDLQKSADPRQKSLSNAEAVAYLRNEYVQRHEQPALAYGMTTGFSNLDEATKGAQPGELWIIGGYSSHGKTSFVVNWMRYLAFEGGYNVLYYTLEMTKEHVWRLLATGHAAHPKWGGKPPLEYERIKSGELNNEEMNFYLNEVLPDLESPEFGSIEVISPTGKATIEDIRARAEVKNRTHPLDIIVIDYIGMLGQDPKKRSHVQRNERINENIAAAKQMALEFDHGNSVLVVSPHQINRCLASDTRVLTDKGLFYIKDLPAGLKVEGTEPRLVKKLFNNGSAPLLRIELEDGTVLKSTKNHLWVKWEEGCHVLEKAENLKVGETLIQGGDTHVWPRDYPKLPLVPQVQSRGGSPKRDYGIPTFLTEDFSYLIGFMLGDGTLRRQNLRFCFNSDETLEEKVLSLFQKVFGISMILESVRSKVRIWSLYRVEFCEWLRLLGITYGRDSETETPWIIERAPRSCIASYLKGLYDAEGSTKTPSVHIGMNALPLMMDVHFYLTMMGIENRTFLVPPSPEYIRPSWERIITLVGKEAHERFRGEIGFYELGKEESLNKMLSPLKEAGWRRRGIPTFRVQPKEMGYYCTKYRWRALNRRLESAHFHNKGGEVDGWSRENLLVFYEFLKEEGEQVPDWLIQIVKGKVRHQRIADISVDGVGEVYDVELDGDSLYYPNSIMSHNSGLREAQKNNGIYEMNALADANEAERCLPKDELIPTSEGYKKLSSVREQIDEVAFSFGKRRVQKWYDSGKQSMLRIKNCRGRVIIVSKNTRVRVWDGCNPVWCLARDLRKNQVLVSAMGYNLFGKGSILRSGSPSISRGRNRENPIKEPQFLTEDLAWLLGYWMGDGHIRSDHRGKILWLINEDEGELRRPIKAFIEDYFGLIAKETFRSGDHFWEIEINSMPLSRWFEANGLFGNSLTKKIPSFLWAATREQVISWLRGIWDAEGSVGKRKRGKQVELGMVNWAIVNGIQELLLNLGIDSRIYENKRTFDPKRPGQKPFPHLYLWGKESTERARDLGLFTLKCKGAKLEEMANREVNKPYSYKGTDSLMRHLLADVDISVFERKIRERLRFWKRNGKEVSLSSRTAKEILLVMPQLKELVPFAEMKWQFSRVKEVVEIGEVESADICVGGDAEYQAAGVLVHNSSDVVLAIYQDTPLRQKDEAIITNLKSRDARVVEPFNIYFSNKTKVMGDLLVAGAELNLQQVLEA